MTNTRKMAVLTVADRAIAGIWSAIRARPGTVLATVAVGLAMTWTALVAAGIAALLIIALPYAVMYALELYMARMGGRPCSTETARQPSAESAADGAHLGPVSNPDHFAQSEMPFDGHPIADDELQPQQERRLTHA